MSTDSFARAQARHDISEHPDFWLDDRAEAFREAVAEECARQLGECHEMSANFIADKIRAEHIRLIGKPEAFVTLCRRMIEAGAVEFLPLLIRTALEVADQRTSEGLNVAEIVAKALWSFTEPMAVPREVGP